jgi:hypothetical protein
MPLPLPSRSTSDIGGRADMLCPPRHFWFLTQRGRQFLCHIAAKGSDK